MASSRVIRIDEANFEAEVLRSKEPFLLDFDATWCGPCKALAPVVEKLADEEAGAVRVGKLDIDESPAIATRFGIRGAPTLLVFKGGQVVARHAGVTTKARLLEMLSL